MYCDENGIYHWKYTPTQPKETGYEQVIDSFNIISIEDFKALDRLEQRAKVKEVIQKIRQVNVYPIYYMNEEGIIDEIMKCMCFDVNFTGDTLNEHGKAGTTLLDFMFPNLHLVEAGTTINNNMYSRFYDDTKLAKCIDRHMKNYRFTSMRTPFFMYGRFFWPTATNFNPCRAKAIYQRFAPQGSVVYDFSAGYGGRMLGALSSLESNYTYVGCEPNKNTAYNLNRLGQYIEKVSKRTDSYKIYNECSETLRLEPNSIDFAFSCPPYYILERYSTEATQSTIKYPEYNAWLNNYAYQTLCNVRDALKPGSLMCFILPGCMSYAYSKYYIANDWCKLAEQAGFTFCKKYPIRTMSRKSSEDAEALYVFRKEV